MRYSEHEKLKEVSSTSQKIGEFLDYYRHKGYDLYHYIEDDTGDEILVRSRKSIQELLAEFFEIDLVKLEKEKEQMLEDIRKINK